MNNFYYKACPEGCSECVSETECSKGSGSVAAIVGGLVGGVAVSMGVIIIIIKKKAILSLKQYKLFC